MLTNAIFVVRHVSVTQIKDWLGIKNAKVRC